MSSQHQNVVKRAMRAINDVHNDQSVDLVTILVSLGTVFIEVAELIDSVHDRMAYAERKRETEKPE